MNNRIKQAGINWLGAFVALADSLATIVSFGIWLPNWEFDFICWRVLRGLKEHKARKENENDSI